VPSSVKIDRLRFFSLRISPSSFLVAFSLRMDSFSCATAASRISHAAVLQSARTSEAKVSISEIFASKAFFVIFSTKSSAICCIMFSIEISPLVSVFPNSYFNTLELISIFFSLKTPQLFYTIYQRSAFSVKSTRKT